MKSKQDLLVAAYQAFNARGIDTILGMMHEDVDWLNGMEGGGVIGRDNVRQYSSRQWKMLDPHVGPIGLEEDEVGGTLATVHQVVKDLAGNLVVDQHGRTSKKQRRSTFQQA